MTRTTTNVIGIIIVILAGMYFYAIYCNSCSKNDETAALLLKDETQQNTFVDLEF